MISKFNGIEGNSAKQAFDMVIFQKRESANAYEIAVRLLYVYKNGLYKKGGFNNIVEYSAFNLHFNASKTYKYIRIADKFLEPRKGGGYETVLKKYYSDYTIGQLIELCHYPIEWLKKLNNDGVITPYMTTAQLRMTLKTMKNN